MRKIRLSIDALAVESFKTVGSNQKNAGTVYAHVTEPPRCNLSQATCFEVTCLQSCGWTNTSPCINC